MRCWSTILFSNTYYQAKRANKPEDEKYVSVCPKMQFGQMKSAPEKYGTFGTHGALQQYAQPLSIMMP